MIYEEYKQKLEELEIEYKNKKNALGREFAMSNNPYKVGDILQDHYQIIRVDSISYSIIHGIPECVYYGTQLKKDLKPKKIQENSPCMFQSNVKLKLN